ncbi:ATP-binding protein [Mycoplasma sp. 3686d]|uniref:ATP-binding protein n=1 Tax=Mycoplasma sp. 3686d TaxID=2967300 RepID=UPI00211B996D|nr:ATP-binding protein [Mycoplasma sp. 3686d]UUM24556.1 ATP-binding protein [Mycoplasma sp. 3686d]
MTRNIYIIFLSQGAIFSKRVFIKKEHFWVPDQLRDDIYELLGVVRRNVGINKFLFQGSTGTGKTESVKQIATFLNRDIFLVDFSLLIDNKLGQNAQNISQLLDKINNLIPNNNIILLIDGLDVLTRECKNQNDIDKIRKITNSFHKMLDELNEQVLLIATTNLYEQFDKDLLKRFNKVIDFNHYPKEDLIDIAEKILHTYSQELKYIKIKNIPLFKKILNKLNQIPYPDNLHKLIKILLTFSEPDDQNGYLRIMYQKVFNKKPNDIVYLLNQGFTPNEIEVLSGVAKNKEINKTLFNLKPKPSF